RLFATRGYPATTLRDLAAEVGVSPALVYRYFDSKTAILLALYDELSSHFEARAAEMPAGTVAARAPYLVLESLATLRPHRAALLGLLPAMIGGGDDGVFAPGTAMSRRRVQGAFERAVVEAADAPAGSDGPALGRALYLAHLAVLLFWLLDE